MEHALPIPLLAENLSSLSGIQHGFFTREGGISQGIYASLNCGLGSADDRTAVLENRSRVCRALGAQGTKLVTVHQCHSAHAVVLSEHPEPDELPKADGIVTTRPGLVIGALAADCAPVLFADAGAGVVAAAHAGWRGAVHGIIGATVAQMEAAGAVRSRIVAAVGPCISQPAYEIGHDFKAEVVQLSPDYARFFANPDALTDTALAPSPNANANADAETNPRPHFDLSAFVAHRLQAECLASVEQISRCTDRSDS
ncbi:MAG: polyphenol oxidase family protein, partial [Pseudomonadota bacterium]